MGRSTAYAPVCSRRCVAQEATSFSAESWNYVSIGMDAKSAFGFHHLRETKPALAFSRAANQAWYGYFSCASGWFCGAEPLNRRMRLEVLGGGDGGGDHWRDIEVGASVKAIVLLNLQSYGGGRDLWGDHDNDVRAVHAARIGILMLPRRAVRGCVYAQTGAVNDVGAGGG